MSHRVSGKQRIGGLPTGKVKRKKQRKYTKKKLSVLKRKGEPK